MTPKNPANSRPAPPKTKTGGTTTRINVVPKQAKQGGGAGGTSSKK